MRYASGTLPTSKGFTGQRADATSGLDYYGARYYDPLAEQFTSADTTLAGGLNRYGYVGGNPETFVDPSGHEYRLGDEGVGGGIDGGIDGGASGGGSGGSPGDEGNTGTSPVTQVSLGDGNTEFTYTGTGDSFVENGAGNDIGVVDDQTGQEVTNDEITQQAEANAQDRLSQGEQPHGDDGQNGADGNSQSTGTNPPVPNSPQDAETYRTSVTKPNGETPRAAVIAVQDGATPVNGYSGQPGVENSGFNLDGHPFNGGCAEVACASQVVQNVQDGEGGWVSGRPVTFYLSHEGLGGPCVGCEDML